ncbi:MAG: DUF222 domain-containing protein [Pseudolysinimonas sp.]
MAPTDDRAKRSRVSSDARNAVGEMLDAMAQIDGIIAGLSAARFELIEQAQRLSLLADATVTAADSGMSQRAFRAELACALLIPEATADRLTSDAVSLVNDLPATLAALRDGGIRERQARILVDQLGDLPADDRLALETLALPLAGSMTAAKFERRVRALREARVPGDHAERHRRARSDRDVVVHPERDGMAWLGAQLPAVDAIAIHSRLDATARSLRRAGDSRTLAQLRADLFCSVLLEGEGAGSTGAAADDRTTFQAIRAHVIVTVPALSLLGRDASPATLEGYGPIDAETARRLVADSPTLQRLLTDPVTGAELVLDRTRYRVTEDLRTWLRVRDGGCRFPGCGRRAGGCDIDHTHDFALDGQTAHNNLAHLCRSHHVLKHATSWSVTQRADSAGDLEWRSPLDRRYVTEPAFERTPAGADWRSPPRFESDPAPP